MSDEETELQGLRTRYRDLAHAMQSGVEFSKEFSGDMTPKHLRVGVNMALCDAGALAGLLIKKGLITEKEHLEALVGMLEKEVERYTDALRGHYNKDVKLI